jgi:hypothetical protein
MATLPLDNDVQGERGIFGCTRIELEGHIGLAIGAGLGFPLLTHWLGWWRYPEMRCTTLFDP